MKTMLLYMTDSRLQQASAKVLDVQTEGSSAKIILDQTIFYAQGGGQPSDVGKIVGPNGTLIVSHVSYNGGAISHFGTLEGTIIVGDDVQLALDWEFRYRNMQMHTAGHILDQAVKNVYPHAVAIDGVHGIGKKLYVEYQKLVGYIDLAKIQQQIDDLVKKNLPINLEMVTYDELVKRNIKLPFDLPKNKDLRIMSIGEYPAMPDGGTQLGSTGESWPITVTQIEERDTSTRIHYVVKNPQQPEITTQQQTGEITLETFTAQADLIRHDMTQAHLPAEEFRQIYLGKKGKLNEVAAMLRRLSSTDKQSAGKILNELKRELENRVIALNRTTTAETWTDMTMPGLLPPIGHVHPVSQAMNEITRIFERIGFIRVRYPEVDWEWYPFDTCNMPKNHPARDEWETFVIQNDYTHPKLGKMVLIPHTSNGQVREMERLKSTPPIRMINIARCYRRQADVTHTEMFHQFEGLVVDKGITIQHLKGTIDHFAREFYGPKAKSRIRPFHFMFTEPSFEVDFSCTICDGTGMIHGEKCRFCKSGWHEVGGAGMVHPNVLKFGGIDPEIYTGFAFGWGIERTYTLRKGLKLDDIRLLYSGDMRFLEQF